MHAFFFHFVLLWILKLILLRHHSSVVNIYTQISHKFAHTLVIKFSNNNFYFNNWKQKDVHLIIARRLNFIFMFVFFQQFIPFQRERLNWAQNFFRSFLRSTAYRIIVNFIIRCVFVAYYVTSTKVNSFVCFFFVSGKEAAKMI